MEKPGTKARLVHDLDRILAAHGAHSFHERLVGLDALRGLECGDRAVGR